MFLCLCRSRSMSWLPCIPLYHSQAGWLSIFFYFWAGCGPLSLFHIPAAVCASSSIPQGFFLSQEPLISLWDPWHGCSSPQVMFSSCCLFSISVSISVYDFLLVCFLFLPWVFLICFLLWQTVFSENWYFKLKNKWSWGEDIGLGGINSCHHFVHRSLAEEGVLLLIRC